MTVAVFDDLDRLLAAAPAELGPSGWVTVDEAAVRAFRASVGAAADATGAAGSGSSEGSSAGEVPPLLLLSLTNRLLPELLQVPGAASGVNYGAEWVRFGAPVPVGCRVRAAATLAGCREVPGGVQTEIEIRVEADGGDADSSGADGGDAGPACAVMSLSRWLR